MTARRELRVSMSACSMKLVVRSRKRVLCWGFGLLREVSDSEMVWNVGRTRAARPNVWWRLRRANCCSENDDDDDWPGRRSGNDLPLLISRRATRESPTARNIEPTTASYRSAFDEDRPLALAALASTLASLRGRVSDCGGGGGRLRAECAGEANAGEPECVTRVRVKSANGAELWKELERATPTLSIKLCWSKTDSAPNGFRCVRDEAMLEPKAGCRRGRAPLRPMPNCGASAVSRTRSIIAFTKY